MIRAQHCFSKGERCSGSRLQPQHLLYSPVNQTKAEVWQVKKRWKLDTPVATAHSKPWRCASRGRGGHSYQNTTTLIPAANLDSLLDADKSQHKEKNQWKMCFYTAWPPKVAKKSFGRVCRTFHDTSSSKWLVDGSRKCHDFHALQGSLVTWIGALWPWKRQLHQQRKIFTASGWRRLLKRHKSYWIVHCTTTKNSPIICSPLHHVSIITSGISH